MRPHFASLVLILTPIGFVKVLLSSAIFHFSKLALVMFDSIHMRIRKFVQIKSIVVVAVPVYQYRQFLSETSIEFPKPPTYVYKNFSESPAHGSNPIEVSS